MRSSDICSFVRSDSAVTHVVTHVVMCVVTAGLLLVSGDMHGAKNLEAEAGLCDQRLQEVATLLQREVLSGLRKPRTAEPEGLRPLGRRTTRRNRAGPAPEAAADEKPLSIAPPWISGHWP